MRGILAWLLSKLLWTAVGAVTTASLVAFAFSALVAAPLQVIAALWIVVALATAAIVVLMARLWSPSPPQLHWMVGRDVDALWDEQRQQARHRLELTATPIGAGGYVMGRTDVTGHGRLIDCGTRQRFTAELPLPLVLEFGPAGPPVQKLEHAVVRQRYRKIGDVRWHSAVVLIELAYLWGANGTLPGVRAFDDDSRPPQPEIDAILAARWEELERWYRSSWGHGFRTSEAVETEELASPAKESV